MKKIFCFFVMLLISNGVNAEEWEYLQMTFKEKKGVKDEVAFPDGMYFSIEGSYQTRWVPFDMGMFFDPNYKTTKRQKEKFAKEWKEIFNVEINAQRQFSVGVDVVKFANILGGFGFELVGIKDFKDKVTSGETWTFKRKL